MILGPFYIPSLFLRRFHPPRSYHDSFGGLQEVFSTLGEELGG